MNRNRNFVVMTVILVLLMSVSVIYAQGPDDGDDANPPNGPIAQWGDNIVEGILVQQAAALTETTPWDVIEARRDGQSIADYVTVNGGDPNAVATAAQTQIEERLAQALADGKIEQERYDEALANLPQSITDGMSNTGAIVQPRNNMPQGGLRNNQNGHGPGANLNIDPAIVEILTEATGLEGQEIFAQLREGKTLTELIEENGGDVEAIKTEVTAFLTANIDERVENLFNTPLTLDGIRDNAQGNIRDRLFNIDMPSLLAEATGLEGQALMEALQSGQTPAELIEANGGDVETVKAEIMATITERLENAVTNGTIDQAAADEISSNLEERIDNILNNAVEFGARRGNRGFDNSNGANQGVLE